MAIVNVSADSGGKFGGNSNDGKKLWSSCLFLFYGQPTLLHYGGKLLISATMGSRRYRDGFFLQEFDKRLEPFAPWYSQSLQGVDFTENYTILWF